MEHYSELYQFSSTTYAEGIRRWEVLQLTAVVFTELLRPFLHLRDNHQHKNQKREQLILLGTLLDFRKLTAANI
jgi:hypothetical protein